MSHSVQRGGQPVQSQTVSNNKVNIAQVAQTSEKPSRLVKHVVDGVIGCASDYIREGCTVSLSFQPLGQFVCQKGEGGEGGEVVFRYSKEFGERMESALKGEGEGQIKAKKGIEARRKGLVEPMKEDQEAVAGSRGGTRRSNGRTAGGGQQNRVNSDGFANDSGNNIFPPPPPNSEGNRSNSNSNSDSNKSNRNRSNQNNIFPPNSSSSRSHPPTPRLSKSAQLRLRAQNLKKENHALQRQQHHAKGARELASHARRAELEATVQMLRNKVIVRGGPYGIRGLSRLLKSCDDDNNGTLSQTELRNCFTDMGIKISSQNLEDVFVYFDSDNSGSVSFDEFMEGIRGELSEKRLAVIDQAFDVIDESGDGDLSMGELKKKFRCESHPSIVDKSATREQVTKEFLGQWDKARADGTIDRDDFISYYHDVGASIDEDDDFIFLIEETWGFEFEDPLAKEFQGLLDQGDDNSTGINADGSGVSDDPYAEDIKEIGTLLYTPPVTLEALITTCGASQISACPSVSIVQFSMVLRKLGVAPQRCASLADSLSQSMPKKGTSMVEIEKLHNLLERRLGGGAKGGSVIDIVKAKLLQRAGSDGLRAVARVMKMMDDDGSRTLSKEELKTGLSDWGLDLNYSEIDSLFTFFDRDNSGSISFDEFLKGMRGPMSERRKNLVLQAFKVVDKTGDGKVTVDDLKVSAFTFNPTPFPLAHSAARTSQNN